MSALVAAGLLAIGAALPGPNNLVVMRTASRCGLVRTLRPIGAIVGGGLAVLVLAAVGVGRLLAGAPAARALLAALGAAYLAWLGLCLVRASLPSGSPPSAPTRRAAPHRANELPTGAVALFGLQLVNPGGWALTLAILSALEGSHRPELVLSYLVVLFTIIPAACLVLWSSLGVRLTTSRAPGEASDRLRVRLDRILGLLLIAFAIHLLAQLAVSIRSLPSL